MIAFRSLNVGENGGVSKDLEGVASSFTYSVQLHGIVTGGVFWLQGSLDDDHWTVLDTVELDDQSDLFQVKSVTSAHAWRYVRAFANNLEGTSPRVTSYIAPRPAGV